MGKAKVIGLCYAGECDRSIVVLGLCRMHYQRQRKHGDFGHSLEERNATYNSQGNPNWRGGKASHPLYWIYHDMVGRCTRSSHARWGDYGGRGIYVCSRWLDNFWDFVQDMGERPEGFVLDRKNNDGPYAPYNCRWTDTVTSARNKRSFGWEHRSRNQRGQFI